MRYLRNTRRRRRYGRRRGGDGGLSVYAAVDLGTNNCRMLAAHPAGGGLRVVDSFSRIVRLGERMAATGRLDEAAIVRTVRALKVCSSRMRANGVTRVRGVATEACRRASNSHDFLSLVRAETGLALESISPAEEARLTVAGCAPLLDGVSPHALVFDIGGGSTEITWVAQANGAPGRVIDSLSLPYGVVVLAERHGGEAIAADVYDHAVDRVHQDLADFDRLHGIAHEVAGGRVQMLGTSGTATTLGAVHLGLERYDRSRVDGLVVGFDRLSAIGARLTAMSSAERAAHPCIGEGRADLVAVGCMVFDAICRRWPVGRLRIADRGIREGLLIEMMAEDGAGAHTPVAMPA